MKALIGINNQILEVMEIPFEVNPALKWIDCPDDCTTFWTYDGVNLTPPVLYVKSFPEIVEEYNSTIQGFLDSVAKQRNYESAIYCTSYASSTNPTWAAEASAFISWRDSVWVIVYQYLQEYEQGQIPLGTVNDLIALFPPMVWPD